MILLLNVVPKSYDQLRDAMLYGRLLSITLDEVVCALKAKKLQKVFQDFVAGVLGEGLMVKTMFTKF